jgi:chitinase
LHFKQYFWYSPQLNAMAMKYFLSLMALMILGFTGKSQSADKFQVIGYYAGNGEGIEKYPLHQLTQIIYSFAHLHGDTIGYSSAQKKQGLLKLTSLKQKYPGLRVLVSVGGWGGCESCSDVFSRSESRQRFAQSVSRLLQETAADGLDMDWEYPVIPGPPGHAYSPADKDNFTALMLALRQAIGPSKILSFAAGGFPDFLIKSIDWTAISPVVDYINLMTYDLVHGYSKQTGHHAPLYSSASQAESVDSCVRYLLQAKVPAGKLVVGLPFYGRIFEQVPPGAPTANKIPGLYEPCIFKQYIGYNQYDTLSAANGWQHYTDPVQQAAVAYHSGLKLFATIETEQSIAAKTSYAWRNRLGGVMFWELQNDKISQGLLEVIGATLKTLQ